jgi:putative ABC transport system ATP-binding protein
VVRALREVSLDVEKGDFIAIVGASGSGKSTMMNVLGCLDRPTRGGYELGGVEVGARSNDARAIVRNRLIGFVFQGFNLLPRTTALENCELPLQYRGVGGRARRKRAEEALRAVGLGDRMDHTPNQLSGGQQQRVAIARALVTDPPLLLADEPTGNLDTRTSLEVLALLQRLNVERKITVVLVTHEADIAACARRVVTMRDGRIVSDVVHETPLAADKALAELPRPAPEVRGEQETIGPRRAGPVPAPTYAALTFGALLGVLVGLLYNAAILGAQTWAVPLVLALVGEAWLGARSLGKRVRGGVGSDQTARAALWYTLGQGTLVLALALAFAPSALGKLAPPTSSGVAFALLGVVLALAGLAATRFGLLRLATALARPRARVLETS